MTGTFGYHIQQGGRRALESRLNKDINNTYDKAETYNKATRDNESLRDAIFKSQGMTARLRNKLSNLEWVTHAENMKHAFNTELANNTGEKNGRSKLKQGQVIEIKDLLSKGELSQYKIADLFGVSRSCILGIKLGRLWSHV